MRHHSKFGGLWIDREDWREQDAYRRVGFFVRRRLNAFVRDGFIILRGAASIAAVDAFQTRIGRAFREGDGRFLYQGHGKGPTQVLDAPVDRLGTRIVDSYMASPEALELFTSPKLIHFLTVIFGEPPMLFQSLSFDQGSQQGLHQDTAYVVVDRPLELAACWIALEDVQPGSGELMYAPGSHRNPDFDFGGGTKHFDPDQVGEEPHKLWSTDLIARAQAGRGVDRFLARKGDILIWHADLAHGGSPITRPELTRQSLVGHFCPASARPNYFRWLGERCEVKAWKGLNYCSEHYTQKQGELAA